MTADEWADLMRDRAALAAENTELRAALARFDPTFELRDRARRTVALTPAQAVAVAGAGGSE